MQHRESLRQPYMTTVQVLKVLLARPPRDSLATDSNSAATVAIFETATDGLAGRIRTVCREAPVGGKRWVSLCWFWAFR